MVIRKVVTTFLVQRERESGCGDEHRRSYATVEHGECRAPIDANGGLLSPISKAGEFARSGARERLQVQGGNHDIVPIAKVKSVSWPRGNRSVSLASIATTNPNDGELEWTSQS
jgi:hypothetical protein